MCTRALNPEKTVLREALDDLFVYFSVWKHHWHFGNVCSLFWSSLLSQTINSGVLFSLLGADWLSLSWDLSFSIGEDLHGLKAFLTKPYNPNLFSSSLSFFFFFLMELWLLIVAFFSVKFCLQLRPQICSDTPAKSLWKVRKTKPWCICDIISFFCFIC